jgi:hypothetical protein
MAIENKDIGHKAVEKVDNVDMELEMLEALIKE